MKSLLTTVAAAVILLPVMAWADNSNSHPGWSIGAGNPHGSAPGPLIGAGLPVLALGGLVYGLIRHRRKNGR
jgi:hypothetical protein